MSVFAHVLGMPVEEVLASAGGAGASLLMARAWLALVVRRRIGRVAESLPRYEQQRE